MIATHQTEAEAVIVPLCTFLRYPATVFRTVIMWTDLYRMLTRKSRSSFPYDFGVGPGLTIHFHHLWLLNRIINRLHESFFNGPERVDLVLLTIILFQTRAVVCRAILKTLEPMLKCMIRWAPSAVPNLFRVFLYFVMAEIGEIAMDHDNAHNGAVRLLLIFCEATKA